MTVGDASSCKACSIMQSEAESQGAQPAEDDVEVSPIPDSGINDTPRSPSTAPSPEAPDRIVDKGKEIERGRTLERGPRYPNPLADAESRVRRNNAAIEIDARPLEKRKSLSRSSTFFDDPSDPCAILDDNLLEPCPHVPICNSVSEILNAPQNTSAASTMVNPSRSATELNPLDIEQPTPALKMVFSDCRPLYPAPTLPPENLRQVLPNITYLEYLAIKSSSPIWQSSQTQNPSHPQLSRISSAQGLAAYLPTEIIHQIYYNLSPPDFNSARHSCRSWFINSLDRCILQTMLRRGGFPNSIRNETLANHILDSGVKVNDEWLLSKRLARECALGPDWTGNGLSENQQQNVKYSAFVQASTIDFTEVGVHPGPKFGSSLFTVSGCGKFLIVATGCLVYIYELNRHQRVGADPSTIHAGSLRPITSIICPRRVIACSMDTSSHRYAIAVLLDGRMGLVCDITILNRPVRSSACTSPNKSHSSSHMGQPHMISKTLAEVRSYHSTSFLDQVSLNSSASNLASHRSATEPPFVFPGIATTGATFVPIDDATRQDVFKGDMSETTRTADPNSRHSSLPRANTLRTDSGFQSILPTYQARDRDSSSMPIETGPRSLYRDLCSDADPPRSVAICPQRRCVAFGCSSGIELHWVDALTGQDLNRWFPLTAPSDYLFFLPPRRSIDSAKKLRLISSAAKPNERAAIGDKTFGSQSRSSPFWERLGRGLSAFEEGDHVGFRQGSIVMRTRRGESVTRSFSGRMDYSDHYRAIPLSDGYHILFTDPASGLLCLGSDAPVGGPTKLLRKIWFQGPENMGSPVAYASASDLSWGVRVVAAFGLGLEQRIWLFSVPADIFAAGQECNRSGAPSWSIAGSGKDIKSLDWLDWWPDDGLQEWLNQNQDPVLGIHPRSIWPVKIRGQEISRCSGVVDLAIDSGTHMVVWAFSKEGEARVWRINDGTFHATEIRYIARDGTVRETDVEGDIEMIDAPAISPNTGLDSLPPQESFDGSSYFTSSAISELPVTHDHIEWGQSRLRSVKNFLDDVLMDNLVGLAESESTSSQDYYEEAAFPGPQHEFQLLSSTHSRTGVVSGDIIEELNGIARINIEIR